MKTKLFIISLIALVLSSCDDKLQSVLDLADVDVAVAVSDDDGVAKIEYETFSFRNVSSDITSKFVPGETISLISGLYDVSYEADATLASGAKAKLHALKTSVVVKEQTKISLSAYCIVDNDDLIIAELFFTGTLQPSGNTYNGDQYIKLYNNTDHIIYADGITIFESKFLTTEKRVYTPDVMSEAVTVQALYTIPGEGQEHPIAPGEFLLICDVAMDHRNANPNSFDLSHADFEWYDESTKPSTMDIDSPLAPNLDKWYCYTQTVWILHNRGFKAYGIARIPVDKDAYLRDYHYSFDYETVTAAGTFPMSGDAYKLPNAWIVDLVTCSVESDYAWQVSSPSIDSGWTACGIVSSDKTRFFRAVRRKLLGLSEAGNPIFKDTNNSTADFNCSVIPSEIELQQTATSASGETSAEITYDGIAPIEQ